MENVRVKDVYKTLTKEPPVLKADDPLKAVVHILLKDPRYKSVFVVDDTGRLIGIVSTLIFLKVSHYLYGKRSVMKDDVFNAIKSAKAKKVGDIMHPPVFVYEETKILDVLEMISRENIQELPVVDGEGKVIGDLNCLEILKRVWQR